MEKAKAIALTVQSLLTLAGAWLSNKLGALAPVLGMLLAAMAIDYISGLVAAAREGLAGGPGLESGKGVRGILKKLGYLLAIAAAMLFDWLLVNVAGQLGFTLPATAIFGLLVAVWFLLNEILSIIENMGRAGVPLPGFLRAAVSALKRTVDKQGGGLAASLEEKEKSHD